MRGGRRLAFLPLKTEQFSPPLIPYSWLSARLPAKLVSSAFSSLVIRRAARYLQANVAAAGAAGRDSPFNAAGALGGVLTTCLPAGPSLL